MNLLQFTGIYWNLLGFAGICWDLLGFAGICWDLLAFASRGVGHRSMADEALFGSMAICEWCPRAIYDIGTEILNFHCFCTMEMFLFSKSIIPDENSVKISRRIFLDRSQGLKCTKKTSFFENLHAALD